jgi:phosphoribosyl-AMP cyclohydrolase
MLPKLKYDEKGLIPAIIQNGENGDVLMMAYMNEASLKMTLETGYTHFWSRSRQKYWKKGETSGNVQEVQAVLYDCDADTLLIKVKQHGSGACHTGNKTCFYRTISDR